MRRILKYITIPCLLLVSAYSCEDEDKSPYIDYNQEETGAFFRTIDAGGTINKTNISGSEYSITGELVSAAGDGSDVTNVEVWVEFVDRTTDGGDDSVPSTLVTSADTSTFTTNENGLPQNTFNVSISSAIAAMGLDVDLIEGGDQFLFQIAINMTDGRTFTKENTGDSVTGELFFNSPMVYTGLVICVLPTPPTGDWVIEMNDSYGDGWNGASITVTIDGVDTVYTLDDGFNTSHTVNVPNGTQTLDFTYSPGAWESEVTYTISAPSGNIVAEDGPGPVVGVIALNLCNETS